MRSSARHRTACTLVLLLTAAGWTEAAPIEDVDRLIRDRHYEAAIAEIDRVLLTRPKDPDLHLRKGICQSMLRSFDAARETFQRGIAAHPKDARFLHNMGLLCMRQKRFDEAESWLQQTLAVRTWHPETNYHLGLIYEGRGDTETAATYYTCELNHNPRCAKAWQRWYALKGTGGTDSHVSLAAIAAALAAMAAGLFVLYRKKRSDDEEIRCAS